jgi:dolichol-phosphate mannosyltransferase
MRKLSVVIPVLNEEKNIPILWHELGPVLKKLDDFEYEVIFVNDGSTDDTETLLHSYTNEDEHIKVISFSRNFGKEIALSAGMHAAQGDAAIMMDVDLLHPPAMIPELITKWDEGSDVVVAIRKSHKGESAWKRFGSYVFYAVLSKISETKIVPYSTDFRLVSRQVLDVFKLCEERNRMTRGLIDWLGFKQSYVYFGSRVRDGQPAYGFSKLVRLAIDSFVKNSLFPLKLVGYLGLTLTSLSSIVGIVVVANKYWFKTGWGANFSAVDMVSIMLVFMVGILLVCMGILALYIADIQVEIRKRPMYVVKDKKNL